MGPDEFVTEMTSAGYPVSTWSNPPGDTYPPHAHSYRKILCCLEGSVTFHTPDGDVQLEQGQRLDLHAGTTHSATVGAQGVRCAEAHLPAQAS